MPHPSATGVCDIWLATPDAAELLAPAGLSAAEFAEWTAVRSPRRRRDWASSRALLAAVPLAAGLQQSLSHSHGYAAVARAPEGLRVGADVEALTARNFTGLARIAFADAEAVHLDSTGDPAQRCADFYELWTLKEAFAKALRLPLADALRQCCFIDQCGERAATVPTAEQWRATVYAPRPELRLAVAWVAPVLEALPVEPGTFEWPPARTAGWPVIRRLCSTATAAGRAC